MKKIALLGSTGSIGVQTLNVVRCHSDKFQIVSLAAGKNGGDFLEQVKEFKPMVATLSIPIENCNLPKDTDFFFGEDAFKNAIIDEADIVVVALVGFKGLLAVLDAIEKGKDIACNSHTSYVGKTVFERLFSVLCKCSTVRISIFIHF